MTLDIPITVEFKMEIPLDRSADEAPIYEWTGHGFDAQPRQLTAIELMDSRSPVPIVALHGRLLYLDQHHGLPDGDGYQKDLKAMADAMWNWDTNQPRPAAALETNRLLTIDRIAVADEYSGNRIGQRTLQAVLRHFPNSLVTCIPAPDDNTALSQRAIRSYWTNQGFQPTATDKTVYWRKI